MKPVIRYLLVGVALLTILLLAIALLRVRARPAPAPPTPSAPTAAPAAPTAEAWVQHSAAGMGISLPAEWQALNLSRGDVQTLFADFEKKNPELARIIGSADALQDVALWAFRAAGPDAAFVDNLNIRRTPLGAQKVEQMPDVLGPVLDQYRQLGFEIGESRADLQIGGHPAARLAYSFQFAAGEGRSLRLSGTQYLIAAPGDLWILSFSAAPGNETTLAPVFEQIAQSFRTQ